MPYKAFNKDLTCRDFQYEVGKVFEMKELPVVCERGFHFCDELLRCFECYYFDEELTVVAEVEPLGAISESVNKTKKATNKIKILRLIPWEEVYRMVNLGKGNIGKNNTGSYNRGDFNTGNDNEGSYNAGVKNRGSNNSGRGNVGYKNAGDHNKGHFNSGSENEGISNSGDCNVGDYNSGYENEGNFNSGRFNKGIKNTGSYNKGDRNVGCNNIGDYNTGNHNEGNFNVGDFNVGRGHVGCFNTVPEPTIIMFNKPCSWTMKDLLNSPAYQLMLNAVGHSKTDWWNRLSEEDKKVMRSLPNFDEEIFKSVIGIEE